MPWSFLNLVTHVSLSDLSYFVTDCISNGSRADPIVQVIGSLSDLTTCSEKPQFREWWRLHLTSRSLGPIHRGFPVVFFTLIFYLLKYFSVTSHHFVEPLVLSFGLWLTLSVGTKARVHPSSPMLCSCLHVMILLKVNSEFPSLDLSQFYTLVWWGYHWSDCPVSLLEWLAEARFKPRALWPKAWCSTNWAILANVTGQTYPPPSLLWHGCMTSQILPGYILAMSYN